MNKPLTNEEIWGVPDDQVPDVKDKDFEACPIAEGYCAFYENNQCRATHCVIQEYEG